MRELKPFRIGTKVDKTNAYIEDTTDFIHFEEDRELFKKQNNKKGENNELG